MTKIRQLETDTALVVYEDNLQDFLLKLDLLWYGYQRKRPERKASWWMSNHPLEEAERLLDLLNSIAPEGYVFQPHPDQPDMFGYWPTT